MVSNFLNNARCTLLPSYMIVTAFAQDSFRIFGNRFAWSSDSQLHWSKKYFETVTDGKTTRNKAESID